MAYYYVNKNAQAGGEHEVHNLSCDHLPYEQNRIYLGNFDDCKPAVREAAKYFTNVDGCYYCSRACHSR